MTDRYPRGIHDMTLPGPLNYSALYHCCLHASSQAEMLFGSTALTLRATNPRTGEQVDTSVAWAGDPAR